MLPVDQTCFENEIDFLLKEISPTDLSNERRRDITNYITNAIAPTSDRVFGIGSNILKCYLPEGDIDMVVMTEHSNDDVKHTLSSIFLSLFHIVHNSNNNNNNDDNNRLYSNTTDNMIIRNIEYVNARTNLIHCVVNNTHIDLTVNQIGAVGSVVFLEEIDRMIGFDHLFKRSILLIKVSIWLYMYDIYVCICCCAI